MLIYEVRNEKTGDIEARFVDDKGFGELVKELLRMEAEVTLTFLKRQATDEERAVWGLPRRPASDSH